MAAPRVHAVPASKVVRPRQCHWVWNWSGVVLRCEDDALPGEHLCADHYISIKQENR